MRSEIFPLEGLWTERGPDTECVTLSNEVCSVVTSNQQAHDCVTLSNKALCKAQATEIRQLKQQRDELRAERDLLVGERDQLRGERDQLSEQLRRLEAGKREVDQGGEREQQKRRGRPPLLPWSSLERKGKREATSKVVEELQNIATSRDTTMEQVAAHIAYR